MYDGNPNLRGINEPIEMGYNEISEYKKCKDDPIYFIENYIKIETEWYGIAQVIPFKLEQYQKDLIYSLHNNKFTIGKMSRQVGKSTSVNAYALWYILFHNGNRVLSAANKAVSAANNIKTLKIMVENLPLWMQQGIRVFNVSTIEFENGSYIKAETTSVDSGRSGRYSLVILDEFAHVDNTIAEEFYRSVYGTISSGPLNKLVIISTPKGINHFHNLWDKARKGLNSFKPIEVNWNAPPGRDEKFKEETLKNTSLNTWLQEYECLFLGSAHSLIPSSVLNTIETAVEEEVDQHGTLIFEKPNPERSYFMTVDVARGRELDNSAFWITDVTEMPYKVVATYTNNEIEPLEYPNVLVDVARRYNEAAVLIEISDAGQEVADIMFNILEYWNVLYVTKTPMGQILGGEDGKMPGVMQSIATKRIGCSTLRVLIENKVLTLNDYRIKEELSNFTLQGASYKAEPGQKDDLVMCGVIFAWATTQDYFKDLTNSDVRSRIFGDHMKQIEEDLIPPGYGFDEDAEAKFAEYKESEWLSDPRYYILLKGPDGQKFLAGKDDVMPEKCHFNYLSFDYKSKEDALQFGNMIEKNFKGFKFLQLLQSNEAKTYMKTPI